MPHAQIMPRGEFIQNIVMPDARLVLHWGSIQTHACLSMCEGFRSNKVDIQIEPLSADEDSTYATDQEHNSSESGSSHKVDNC